MISINDFKSVEMKIGKIESVERVPDTDKLLKLTVDFGIKLSVESSPDLGIGLKPIVGKDTTILETEDEGEQVPQKEERDVRQVISGIAGFFEDPQTLVGIKCPFVTNLEQRTIRGLVSEAMIVAAHTNEGVFSILEPTQADIPEGTKLN